MVPSLTSLYISSATGPYPLETKQLQLQCISTKVVGHKTKKGLLVLYCIIPYIRCVAYLTDITTVFFIAVSKVTLSTIAFSLLCMAIEMGTALQKKLSPFKQYF